jgi:adenine-specific DNA-methyltransferase
MLYFSYCLQRAYIQNNAAPSFSELVPSLVTKRNSLFDSPLDRVISYLNQIEPIEGFIYNNFSRGGTSELEIPRTYFTDENARKIDAIRTQIETWKTQEALTDDEYFILLSCLIESASKYANTTSVYAAFLKRFKPRAQRPFELATIGLVYNERDNESYNVNSLEIAPKIDVDILYLDPPYNERQYASNYHLLETIARYDNPDISGVVGMRDCSSQRSSFCNKVSALKDLEYVASNSKYKYMLLSYNSEGIVSNDEILNVLDRYGKTEVVEFGYQKFKSTKEYREEKHSSVKERLYMLRA